MNDTGAKSLQNVLSVSTAANNRYLFHFSSLNSLTQWTAAIRLSMYEHTTLQEAYTGSLIAGKGRGLNNIRQIMEKSNFKYEDWARVRFGAGTPWRRCWFVVTPPDEKEVKNQAKAMKKKSAYGKAPVIKGDLKFYETKKVTKRTKPIATIKDAYSAYAVYPQSKPLIDQSTLVKIEGRITVNNESSSHDGFVFVMPEIHPAISGFEMMLRFLFPVWDTFHLYGRPTKLVADVRDQRGLMFAMPRDRRYGYLELLDVSGLIHADGGETWTERDWRFKMKELTAKRMNIALENSNRDSLIKTANASRTSLPPTRNGRLQFDTSPRRTPEPRHHPSSQSIRSAFGSSHRRAASDNASPTVNRAALPPRSGTSTSNYNDGAPPPPPHREPVIADDSHGDVSSDSSGKTSPIHGHQPNIPPEVRRMAAASPPPGPVSQPPTMSHAPNEKPLPGQVARPVVRGANIDSATLSQLKDVSQPTYGQQSYGDRRSWAGEEDHPTNFMQQHYQYPPPASRYHNHQGSPARLAPIPASPYVDQNGTDKSPVSYFPQGETIHESLPLRPAPPPHGSSTTSIHRKPLPGGSPAASRDNSRPSTAEEPWHSVQGSPMAQPRHTSGRNSPSPNMYGSPESRRSYHEPAYGPPIGMNHQYQAPYSPPFATPDGSSVIDAYLTPQSSPGVLNMYGLMSPDGAPLPPPHSPMNQPRPGSSPNVYQPTHVPLHPQQVRPPSADSPYPPPHKVMGSQTGPYDMARQAQMKSQVQGYPDGNKPTWN
jgi:CCR4-NOT transcriptional complex subunit CAF120